MRYYQLAALIPAAAFVAASVLTACGVVLAWPRVHQRLGQASAMQRARCLAWLRLAPASAGVLGAVVIGTIFLRFEPRDTSEPIGVVLLATSALLPVLVAAALGRLAGALRASRECTRLLRACGRTFERADGTRLWLVATPYPVAAVVGIVRPRLLLSTRIVQECSPAEVEAVIRHEVAHIRRRDNLVRAAMQFLPDPLSLVRTGREITAAWSVACEEAADDTAAGQRIETRAELAAALVRVARMADGPPPAWMPALAFFEGSSLEGRVRRLLTDGPPSVSGRSGVTAAALGCAAALVATTDTLALRVHWLMEWAVQVLP